MTTNLRSRRAQPWNPNRPLRPDRCPIFYGWVILVVSSIGILASIPGQTMGVSVFSDHLIKATGLSRLQLSNAYLVGTLTSGLLLPLGGRFLARYGERRTAVVAALGLAIALTWLSFQGLGRDVSQVDSVQASSNVWVPFTLLALGFILLRFSGQGMLTLSSRNLVPKWFERRRGFVAGISGALVSLGFSIAPPVLAAWIDAAGDWRAAMLQIALVLATTMTLIAWVFYRDDPEMCGLTLDGDPPLEKESEDSHQEQTGRIVTPTAALRSGPFWAVTLALGLQSGMITGLTFHIVDIGAEAQLDQHEVLSLFLPIAVLGVLTGIVVGAISDRVRLRFVLIFYLLAITLGYSCLSHLSEPFFRTLAIIGLGLASGCFGMLTTVAAAKLFGRAHLGVISSIQMSLLVIASALGPSLFALSRQMTGSYGDALVVGACIPSAILVITLCSRDPARAKNVW